MRKIKPLNLKVEKLYYLDDAPQCIIKFIGLNNNIAIFTFFSGEEIFAYNNDRTIRFAMIPTNVFISVFIFKYGK